MGAGSAAGVVSDLVAIAGIIGVIFAVTMYALLYGAARGWVTMVPADMSELALWRDAHALLCVSVALIIYSQVRP
jgi:hypothetical protein